MLQLDCMEEEAVGKGGRGREGGRDSEGRRRVGRE